MKTLLTRLVLLLPLAASAAETSPAENDKGAAGTVNQKATKARDDVKEDLKELNRSVDKGMVKVRKDLKKAGAKVEEAANDLSGQIQKEIKGKPAKKQAD
jgi:hypothetical protein